MWKGARIKFAIVVSHRFSPPSLFPSLLFGLENSLAEANNPLVSSAQKLRFFLLTLNPSEIAGNSGDGEVEAGGLQVLQADAFEINVNLVWSSGATPMIGNAILLETGGGTRRLHSGGARLSNERLFSRWFGQAVSGDDEVKSCKIQLKCRSDQWIR